MILGGTRSTFGEQNQSIRLTAPSVGFGTAGRTDKVFNEATETLNLGKTSPGAQFCLRLRSTAQLQEHNLPRLSHGRQECGRLLSE